MIKKIFFQSIFFNFFFLKEVFAAESGGMPQLNPEFWISQIFWLTLTFGILYIVLSKLILPKISANLELRKSQIQDNIEAAEKQRKDSESKLKEYDDIIFKSKLEAKNIFKIPYNKIDILVHSAIFAAPLSPVEHIDKEDLNKSLSTNILATQEIISMTNPLLSRSKKPTAVFFSDRQSSDKFFGSYSSTKDAQYRLAYWS